MSISSEITRISNNIQDTIDVIEQTGVSIPAGANSDNLPSLAQALANEKQDKLTGTQGQVVGFDENGNAVPQAAPNTGVTSFNGRTGAVTPQRGDYTADMVGARPNTWTPTASDVGAAPSSHTHAASEIVSGTFSTSRLPTIPLTKGGTGKTTAAKSLYALINGCLSLTDATIASGDYFALLDISATTGKRITLANLCDYLSANLSFPSGANIETGGYTGTGTSGNANRNSLSFPFSPRVVIVSGEVEGSSITMIAVKPVYYVPVIAAYSSVNGGGVSSNNAFWSTNSFSWYSDAGVIQQLNYDGVTYGYAAFG